MLRKFPTGDADERSAEKFCRNVLSDAVPELPPSAATMLAKLDVRLLSADATVAVVAALVVEDVDEAEVLLASCWMRLVSSAPSR